LTFALHSRIFAKRGFFLYTRILFGEKRFAAMKTFYVTTPIYYANSLPHLGHLYTTTVADAIKRHKAQRGFDVYFLTGTDEHGINIQRAAEQNRRTPQAQVDYVAGELKQMFAAFGLDTTHGGYDVFMRTTAPFHREGVQNFWRQMQAGTTPKGNAPIYLGFYAGWFCAACAEFKTENEYKKPEKEGAAPLCLIHERPLDRVDEESYFFRLSDYGETLLDIIAAKPERIQPAARRHEIVAFIKQGLQDLSISRLKTSVAWGIPVPNDPKHTIYLWVDALSNYLTAIGYGNAERAWVGFEKYWQNVAHLVGKDILRFHTIYWWAFLLAAGLRLPDLVFAHGLWLDADGRKMSKTLGNVVELPVLQKYFAADAVRYFLLREMAFGQDGKFGYENLIDRVNADLANGLGNLSSRTLTMIAKYRDGKIPDGSISDANALNARRAQVQPDAQETAKMLERTRHDFLRQFEQFEFHRALETVWTAIARTDEMISVAKPWNLIKDEQQRETLNAVLYRAAETLRWLCVLLYPALPDAAQRIYRQIGLSGNVAAVDPATLRWGELPAGNRIDTIEALFPRLEKQKIMNQIEAEKISDGSRSANAVAQTTEKTPSAVAAASESVQAEENFITIEEFLKVELRVGEIKTAERVPKSDKLLRFEIDLGEEKPRQILAGLAECYEPEKLVGRKVVVVANLKPRKMRGLESNGMVCAASLGESDTPALATFIENVPNGARLK
jgi:methionyl-tRNA synthetase